MLELLQKYDIPTPRYTSYPTVPYWDLSAVDTEKWFQDVLKTFEEDNHEISLYVHLPFCENLCTFCACNKRITKNHSVESPYIYDVLKEWSFYLERFPQAPVVKEIHLGGGTPTFFSPDNLRLLIEGILKNVIVPEDKEFSIEVHPNYCTEDHIKMLADLGFNRISVGIQDFDPDVQFLINRIQTFESTAEVVDWSRKYGYSSVNVDLVYGLPHQKKESVDRTIELMNSFSPDRIAYYSYAHVPWKSKGQRRYNEADLPNAREKWEMYMHGREKLFKNGYEAIGMDHFALKGDKLLEAAGQGTMHRNFMGYTTTSSKLLIGLGASSISDSWGAFVQNEKHIEDYQREIRSGKLPTIAGHLLNEEDKNIRRMILDLMCRNSVELRLDGFSEHFAEEVYRKMNSFAEDELLTIESGVVTLTSPGSLFVRNIASALDLRMWMSDQERARFSSAI